jgi:hypothetical protein
VVELINLVSVAYFKTWYTDADIPERVLNRNFAGHFKTWYTDADIPERVLNRNFVGHFKTLQERKKAILMYI